MGLMYVFPVSKDEEGFVVADRESLILKSYGLPYIFWAYAAASIAVIFFMFLAIKQPVLKLVHLGDETDATLGYSLLAFIGLLPVAILSFFFYEKRIISHNLEIRLEHRVFGLKFFSEKFDYKTSDDFTVDPYLSSPNIARMKANDETQGFQNKGYFVLWLKNSQGKKIQVDRHSRKTDLLKLKELITSGK